MNNDKRILVAIRDETPEDHEEWQFIESTLRENNFQVFMTSSGFSAIQEMRECYPLVLVEMDLSGIGGMELFQTAVALDADTQVLIISAEENLKEVLEALRLGAYDYILRPLNDVVELMNKVHNAWATRDLTIMNKKLVHDLTVTNEQLRTAKTEIEQWNIVLESRVKQRTLDLEQLFRNTINSILKAMEAKDPYTHGHSNRVSSYSEIIGRELGMPDEEIDALLLSAELHDIGKIGIRDKILSYPGKLSPEDLEIMRGHPVRGAEILEPIVMLAHIIPGVRWHHEWFDGTGYPDGLKGENIPMQARIIGIADTFDAMTATRSYQKGMDPDWVVEKIIGWAGTRYDPNVVNAFVTAYRSGRLKIIAADESLVETYDGNEIPVVGPLPIDKKQILTLFQKSNCHSDRRL